MPCDGDDDLQENPMYDSAVWTSHQSSLEHIYSSPSVMRLHHNIPTELNLSYALPSNGEKSFEKEERSLYIWKTVCHHTRALHPLLHWYNSQLVCTSKLTHLPWWANGTFKINVSTCCTNILISCIYVAAFWHVAPMCQVDTRLLISSELCDSSIHECCSCCCLSPVERLAVPGDSSTETLLLG